MKKLFLVCLLPLLGGCAALLTTTSSFSEQVYLGMPLDEFKSMAKKSAINVRLDALSQRGTTFRTDRHNADGHLVRSLFYYFDAENSLVEVETRDYPVEHHPATPASNNAVSVKP